MPALFTPTQPMKKIEFDFEDYLKKKNSFFAVFSGTNSKYKILLIYI